MTMLGFERAGLTCFAITYCFTLSTLQTVVTQFVYPLFNG